MNDAYKQGFLDGIAAYAWSKDGTQWVGTTGRTLKTAQEQVEKTWNYSPPAREYVVERPEVKRAQDMDVFGDLWGIRFTDGCHRGCVELYVEDDTFWHLKATFDKFWLDDLLAVVAEARSKCESSGGNS